MSKFATIDNFEIDRIDCHPACDIRLQQDQDAVDIFADIFGDLPPIVVFAKKESPGAQKDHWLGDGYHRILSAQKKGLKYIKAEVRAGSYTDAFHHASRANTRLQDCLRLNGVPTRPADGRHRVEVFKKRPEAKGMTQQAIADVCDVTQQYVSGITIITTDCKNGNSPHGPASPNSVASRVIRPAIEQALRQDPTQTNVAIAEQCRVSAQTVAKVRKDLDIPSTRPGVGRPASTKSEAIPPAELPSDEKLDSEPIPLSSSNGTPAIHTTQQFTALTVVGIFADEIEPEIVKLMETWPQDYQRDFVKCLYFFARRMCSERNIQFKEISNGT